MDLEFSEEDFEFQKEVSQFRTDSTDSAVGALSKLAVDAVETLKEIMQDESHPPAARVTAAGKVLTLLAPLAELHELRLRLDALEAAAKGVVG